MYYYLDMQKWPRKRHYDLFRGMDYPQFNVCANVDISEFYENVKRSGKPFYRSLVYVASRTANSIDEFKLRIRDDKVIAYDIVHPSFTVLEGGETFNFCTAEYKPEINSFLDEVDQRISALKDRAELEEEPGRDDLLYITCLPWVSFTSITHPINMHPQDSIPRLSWGRYFKEDGLLKLPFSVQVNHALMDGFHVGKYYNMLQEFLDDGSQY